MPSTRLLTFAALVALSVAVPAARADSVVLLDGRSRTGTVVSEDDRFVVLETRIGRIRIARSDVAEVLRDADPAPTEAPAAGSGTTGGDEGIKMTPRRVAPTPTPETDTAQGADPPRADDGAPSGDPAGGASDADAAATGGATANDDASAAAERQKNRRRSRVMRRTSPRAATEAATPRSGDDTTTLAGQDLASVAPGTHLIVFEAPHAFGAIGGAIELGRRSVATLEMAGVRTAWLTVGNGDTAERRGMRLSQIQRHVTLADDLDRKYLFDGIDNGDWVRVHLDDGSTKQGRFEGASSDRVFLTTVDADGGTDQTPISARKVRTVDGLIQSADILQSLRTLMDHENVSITMWPDGKIVLGRYVIEEFSRTIGLDTDDDGVIDTRVPNKAPIAEILRVPMTFRETSIELKRGDVVRVRHAETFDDALVRHATVARVAAVSAHALSLQADVGAEIVPWGSVRRLVVIAENPETALSASQGRLDPATMESSAPVLPGVAADSLSEIAAASGLSAVDDGRHVTHVFFAPPYDGDVFGVHLGENAEEGIKRSPLVFDTVVVPRGDDARRQPSELHSDTVEGVHVTLLVDSLGRIASIELSRAEAR